MTRGTNSAPHDDPRLRIRAHPDAIASRALVTVPVRQIAMGAALVPLNSQKHRTDHPLKSKNHSPHGGSGAGPYPLCGFFRVTAKFPAVMCGGRSVRARANDHYTEG